MADRIAQHSLRRDRLVIIVGLVLIAILAWLYMIHLAMNMGGMDMEMSMPQMQAWNGVDFILMFIMWWIMMIAMMTPSVAPMVLTFSTINRQKREGKNPYTPTSVFLAGYLVAWAGYSAVATLAQWVLHSTTLLSPMMDVTSPLLGGGILVTAGIFQFLPVKRTCLNHCRTPMGFLMTEWRDGARGAFEMGLRHGKYCVGCCWLIMALLFVVGIMNLLWVAALALFVLVEKIVPTNEWIGRVMGMMMIAWGLWMMVA